MTESALSIVRRAAHIHRASTAVPLRSDQPADCIEMVGVATDGDDAAEPLRCFRTPDAAILSRPRPSPTARFIGSRPTPSVLLVGAHGDIDVTNAAHDDLCSARGSRRCTRAAVGCARTGTAWSLVPGAGRCPEKMSVHRSWSRASGRRDKSGNINVIRPLIAVGPGSGFPYQRLETGTVTADIDRDAIAAVAEAVRTDSDDVPAPETYAELSACFGPDAVPLRNQLYRGALRMTRNPTDAEDVLHQTMVKASVRFGSFHPRRHHD
jgi:hypothetical protein